ncbi:MAG: MFS transporter [Pyrinomonadaceae bacterium]
MKDVVQIAAGETAFRRNAVLLQVGVVTAGLLLITLSVNLEVPLYGAYAQAAGYGSGSTAVVFAAYVAGLLPVLFLLGGISDWIGRKKAMVLGLLVALTATGSVIVSPSMNALFAARILQGIGVGLSLGAGTAYLSEILGVPARAASYAGIATTVGLGSGPLITSGSP